MNNKAKNILIVILLLIIVCLTWMLFELSYGRYCKPIIREVKYPKKRERKDSIKKIKLYHQKQTKIMDNKDIEDLLHKSGAPSVSIIVPVHRVSPERLKDEGIVSKAVNQAKELLKKEFEKVDSNRLIKNIDELIEDIDYSHSKEGIGIFASPGISKVIKFPFPVVEKVKVGDTFDSRDLLYYVDTIIDYCVLSISKKHIHLYMGKGEDLREVKNEDFPIDYVETYEYEKPSRGTSFGNTLKEFERDKSVLQEIRLVDFLRTADHSLDKYLNGSMPLVISGGTKEVADFLQVTQHLKSVIGKVVGNYNFNGDLKLAGLAWEEVQNHFRNKNKIIISNLHELSIEMLASGVEKVWEAAKEGKGLELIVEKDFESNGYIINDGYNLKLEKPFDAENYLYINNAVERIINIVKEKKGKIVFVDNDELKDFNGIALKLRYSNNS
jgi:hypothetical protein